MQFIDYQLVMQEKISGWKSLYLLSGLAQEVRLSFTIVTLGGSDSTECSVQAMVQILVNYTCLII